MKKYLIILQQPPFASSHSLEALELTLALTAFDQPITLLFMQAGALQLLNKQGSEAIYHKDFTKVYAGLDLFDISEVYIEATALQKYALDPNMLSISPTPLSADQITSLISKHDIVLSF